MKNSKKSTARWLGRVFFPAFLTGRAIASTHQALRGNEVLKLEQEGIVKVAHRKTVHKVPMKDGARLNASLWLPEGEGPFPIVIMIHFWPTSRLIPDMLYAASFARRGYAVLTYTCRGFGLSDGPGYVASPTELDDLSTMIDWVTSKDQSFPVDPDRIGLTGISYGGGQTFLALSSEPRIKAAVPMNGWTDLYRSLAPNGSWKHFWSLLLYITAPTLHRFNPRHVLSNWLFKSAVEMRPDKIEMELANRSAINTVDKVTCPTFIVHSWNDDLFEPNQVLDYYQRLKAPKKLLITNGIHGSDPLRGDNFKPNQIWIETRRWFDFWLKNERDNGVDKEPEVSFFQPWNRRNGSSRHWPPEGFAEALYYLGGSAMENCGTLSGSVPSEEEPFDRIINNCVTNLHTSGPPIVPIRAIRNWHIPGIPWSVPGDSAAYTSNTFGSDVALVGAPRVQLFAASTTTECQLNVFLYDLSPKGYAKLVTHGTITRRGLTPGVTGEYGFELVACAHRFNEGHKAKLVICASDPAYAFPVMRPGQYHLKHDVDSPSCLAMPLMSIIE